MTIHHTLTKKAAQANIALVEEEDGVFSASFPIGPLNAVHTFRHDHAKTLLDAAIIIRRFLIEYPRLVVLQNDDDFDFLVSVGDDEGSFAEFPDVEDAIITALENAPADEPEPEDEGKISGSVVPHRYRAIYKERGHPAHCGDWLANTLNELCHVEGKFVVHLLTEIAEVNNVSFDQYLANPSRGWQGRFRMSVRNRLAKAVVLAGFLVVPGEDNRVPPSEWLSAHTAKPKPTKVFKEPKAKAKASRKDSSNWKERRLVTGYHPEGEPV